ncbi:hypothetical protein [Rhodoferax antarcticus]|uniref:Uncharacterized protein n=1 Tax=Rhodoferax antarcticus ANT.BR TaxID=1111071 RepID=A0A1Q8YJU2_9BURK|nr:hypothetical protein [Rhodoferax antarcticus]OLP08282.1 hypothetical protein BLL52_0570 [Rhodoferax antarcticus ANT.BR]
MPGAKLLHRLKAVLSGSKLPPTDYQRAQALIAAIDAGGIPLNAVRVNDIARKLGLDVPVTAPVEDTIARIRVALQRQAPPG